jgi:lipopolysaccharide heptosyltransferase II
VPALPRRILIVRLGAIGDVVNALVLATALKDARPELQIGWVAHDLVRPLLERHPALARVHLWPRSSGLRGLRALLRELRAERYELAIDLQRLAKSALLARGSGAPRVLGFDRARCKEASYLFTRERLAPRPAARPMVLQYLEFATHLGLSERAPRFELPSDPSAAARAQAWLGELGAAPVLFNLGASKRANRWPVQHWRRLAEQWPRAGAPPVVLTGGREDQPAAADVLPALRGARALDLTGRTSLLELAELARRSAAMVSGDTGPMHLAAAVGAPVLALFGAGDERRTGPQGAAPLRQRALRALPPPACAPCQARHCSQSRHACMLDLTPERVLESLRDLLAEGR